MTTERQPYKYSAYDKHRKKQPRRTLRNALPYRPRDECEPFKVTEIVTRVYALDGYWWVTVKVQKVDNHRISGFTDEMFLTKEAGKKLKLGDIIYR